jgi:hypothetical protein
MICACDISITALALKALVCINVHFLLSDTYFCHMIILSLLNIVLVGADVDYMFRLSYKVQPPQNFVDDRNSHAEIYKYLLFFSLVDF